MACLITIFCNRRFEVDVNKVFRVTRVGGRLMLRTCLIRSYSPHGVTTFHVFAHPGVFGAGHLLVGQSG